MAYSLTEINYRTVADPAAFVAECDEGYQKKVAEAADLILENRKNSPIVLLSGPSGSGKTTTSMKIAEELQRRGIGTHYVGMDDYFKTVDHTTPRTESGELDLESPLCLDMELLNRHFSQLEKGERVYVPKYEFSRRMRIQEPSKSIKLKPDEIVIFEGIHALNTIITANHPNAFKLYISARSDVEFQDSIVFKRTWFRLVRRLVRDYKFRGSDPKETMSMWANVRRGEMLYISPFKRHADFQFDTSLAYELAVYNHTATKLFQSVPEGIERFDELRAVLPALQLFGDIDEALVADDSLVREFIGGGRRSARGRRLAGARVHRRRRLRILSRQRPGIAGRCLFIPKRPGTGMEFCTRAPVKNLVAPCRMRYNAAIKYRYRRSLHDEQIQRADP